MAIYSVHEPSAPRRPSSRALEHTAPERFAFVRDGFYFWAFLLPPLWMIRRGLWLVLIGYLLLNAALTFGLPRLGVSPAGVLATELALAVLIGLEAGTLRRWTLRRHRWRELGVVEGHNRDDAERRFFERWAAAKRATAEAAVPAETAATPARTPRWAPLPDIIGLFPEPEPRR